MRPDSLPNGPPPPPPNQGAILTAVQDTLQGHTYAFRIIVEQYTPLLFSLALRMTGSREDAEEAVQEIFIKAYAALPSFRIEKRFHPWIYTIALNYLRTFFNKKARRRRVESVVPHEQMCDRSQAVSEIEPVRRMRLDAAEASAARALRKLRHEYRAVFVLRAFEDVPFSDIAAMLAIPEGTAKTFYHRAKQALVKSVFRETDETETSVGSIE